MSCMLAWSVVLGRALSTSGVFIHLVVAEVDVLELGRARVEVDGGDIGQQIVLKLNHPKVTQGRQRGW